MRKFFNALQDKVSTREHHDQANIAVDDGPFPSDSDLFKYRKQRGVNLGAIYVQRSRRMCLFSFQAPGSFSNDG